METTVYLVHHRSCDEHSFRLSLVYYLKVGSLNRVLTRILEPHGDGFGDGTDSV